MASESADTSALEWETVAVSQIILIEVEKPLWKIVCADASAYYSRLRHVVELAQRAIDEGQLIKAGYLRDRTGRLMLHSVVLTAQRCAKSDTQTTESERDGFLF